MAHAVHKICKTRIKRNHWLDHADDKYSFELIADIKAVLAAVILFVTFPIYWALHDQQGSRWVLQASRMNGVLGSWTVRPDQMPTVNSLLVLILIPLFDKGLYPMFAKFSLLKTPLQKMCVGGILLALAFLVSAVVEFQVQPTYAKLPGPGEAQLRIYNGMNSSLNLRINFTEEVIVLKPLEMWDNLTLKVTKTQTFGVNICNAEYTSCSLEDEITSSVKVTEGKTPKSMKSLISSVYLLTNAIGSLIVITVTEASIITNQAYEFLLFAGLMVADTAVLIYMASRYKYVSFADDSRSEGSEILIDVKKASEYHGNDNVNFQT